MHSDSVRTRTSNDLKDKSIRQLDIFVEKFTETISTRQLAHIREPDSNTDGSGDTHELNIIVKKSQYQNILYWIKKNFMVRSFIAKRQSFMTTLDIILSDGEALKINMV